MPCSNGLAVVERYAPDFWGDDFPNCAGTFHGTRKSIEQRRAGPVGQQYPHFAAFEAVRSVCQYAQLFRIRQVNGRFCRLCRIGQRHAEPIGYARRQRLIDIAQMRHRTRPNVEPLTLTQFEHQRVAQMLLLDGHLAEIEHPRLTVVVGKSFRADAHLFAFDGCWKALEAERRIFTRTTLGTPTIGLVIGAALRVDHRHMPVLLKMHHRAARRVDRKLSKIRTSKPLQLSIEIREVPTMQQRIVAEIYSRRHVLRTKRNLLGFREEIIDIPVKRHRTDQTNRNVLFGDELGRIEMIERQLVSGFLIEQLDAQIPNRKIPSLNRIP